MTVITGKSTGEASGADIVSEGYLVSPRRPANFDPDLYTLVWPDNPSREDLQTLSQMLETGYRASEEWESEYEAQAAKADCLADDSQSDFSQARALLRRY